MFDLSAHKILRRTLTDINTDVIPVWYKHYILFSTLKDVRGPYNTLQTVTTVVVDNYTS